MSKVKYHNFFDPSTHTATSESPMIVQHVRDATEYLTYMNYHALIRFLKIRTTGLPPSYPVELVFEALTRVNQGFGGGAWTRPMKKEIDMKLAETAIEELALITTIFAEIARLNRRDKQYNTYLSKRLRSVEATLEALSTQEPEATETAIAA